MDVSGLSPSQRQTALVAVRIMLNGLREAISLAYEHDVFGSTEIEAVDADWVRNDLVARMETLDERTESARKTVLRIAPSLMDEALLTYELSAIFRVGEHRPQDRFALYGIRDAENVDLASMETRIADTDVQAVRSWEHALAKMRITEGVLREEMNIGGATQGMSGDLPLDATRCIELLDNLPPTAVEFLNTWTVNWDAPEPFLGSLRQHLKCILNGCNPDDIAIIECDDRFNLTRIWTRVRWQFRDLRCVVSVSPPERVEEETEIPSRSKGAVKGACAKRLRTWLESRLDNNQKIPKSRQGIAEAAKKHFGWATCSVSTVQKAMQSERLRDYEEQRITMKQTAAVVSTDGFLSEEELDETWQEYLRDVPENEKSEAEEAFRNMPLERRAEMLKTLYNSPEVSETRLSIRE